MFTTHSTNINNIMMIPPMSDAEYSQKHTLLNRIDMNTRYVSNGCFMTYCDAKLVEKVADWDAFILSQQKEEDETHSYDFCSMPRRMFESREVFLDGTCCY